MEDLSNKACTHHLQDLGNPTTRIAMARKLASEAARPSNKVENEFFRCGLSKTRIDMRLPMIPKVETVVRARPST